MRTEATGTWADGWFEAAPALPTALRYATQSLPSVVTMRSRIALIRRSVSSLMSRSLTVCWTSSYGLVVARVVGAVRSKDAPGCVVASARN